MSGSEPGVIASHVPAGDASHQIFCIPGWRAVNFEEQAGRVLGSSEKQNERGRPVATLLSLMPSPRGYQQGEKEQGTKLCYLPGVSGSSPSKSQMSVRVRKTLSYGAGYSPRCGDTQGAVSWYQEWGWPSYLLMLGSHWVWKVRVYCLASPMHWRTWELVSSLWKGR